MRTARVMVLPYDGAWKEAFETIKEESESAVGNLGISDREAFCYSDKPHLMLYVCPQHSRELHRHITFRDYLRSHPDAVKQYGTVKEEAARLFPNDIEGYIAHKTPCIEALYRRCGLI